MNLITAGQGTPLLLIHGLGGSWRSWKPIIGKLGEHRLVMAIDLPGHGDTPPLDGETSIRTLADAVSGFLQRQGLLGIDAIGSSMGARLVLELARRGGILGGVVSLDPGGFWRGWERHAFFSSIWASIRLVRRLQRQMPAIAANRVARSALLAQFSPRPWLLPPSLVLEEMRSYAVSPVFDELLTNLAYGEEQAGAGRGSITSPLFIGWGDRDRVCFPQQARRAQQTFPDARLQWFKGCGHFPHWDRPDMVASRILLALNHS